MYVSALCSSLYRLGRPFVTSEAIGPDMPKMVQKTHVSEKVCPLMRRKGRGGKGSWRENECAGDALLCSEAGRDQAMANGEAHQLRNVH
jgi:hypothetical protein